MSRLDDPHLPRPGRRTDGCHVLVVGGGVAALEGVLALREIAGSAVTVDWLTRDRAFVYRPVSVAEPFDKGEARHFELSAIAADQGAVLHSGSVIAVDPVGHRVVTAEGGELTFDLLLLAVGARPVETLPGALTFRGVQDTEAMRRVLHRLEQGVVSRLAFALPVASRWPLPLYELALMTAAHASARGVRPAITIVTPEERPLEVFGSTASTAVEALLQQRGIDLRTMTIPEQVTPGALRCSGGASVAADCVVTTPRLVGPHLTGLPADADGFIPTDLHGQVNGVSDVYAAGDATTFPLKQGGLAAQQADAAAEAIAARAGVAVIPRPFTPVVRGLLLTGGVPLYLRAEGRSARPAASVAREAALAVSVPPGRSQSSAASSALWWPPSKIAGRYLAPYLATARPSPLGFAPLTDRAAPARHDDDDADHQAACELTLTLAEYDARWGDYALALHGLEAAAALNGGMLPPEYETQREQWTAALAPGHDAAPPR